METALKTTVLCMAALMALPILSGCEGGGRRGRGGHAANDSTAVAEQQTATTPAAQQTQAGPISYKLYIESSASIYGYFDETKGCKDVRTVLYKMASNLSIDNLSFINSTEIPATDDAATTLGNMRLSDFKKFASSNNGNPAASNLSEIIASVAQSTRRNGEVAFLVSDFIYCPSKAEALTSLGPVAQKADLEKLFSNQGAGLAVAIYKGMAKFDGQFYTGHFEQKGKTVSEINYHYSGDRPYYVWAIGGQREIAKLVNGEPLEGLSEPICLTSGVEVKFNTINKKDSHNHNTNEVKPDKSKHGNPIFQVKVTDTGTPALPAAYLTDPANYTTSNANFSVSRVEEKDGVYILTIEGDKVQNDNNFSITLNGTMPNIKSWGRDEWDIRSSGAGQTCGFSYMVEGVKKAMNNDVIATIGTIKIY